MTVSCCGECHLPSDPRSIGNGRGTRNDVGSDEGQSNPEAGLDLGAAELAGVSFQRLTLMFLSLIFLVRPLRCVESCR